MNRIFIRIIAFVLLSGLITSCSEPSQYNEKFKLDDPKSQLEFIERLKHSGIEFRVGKDGYIQYRSKDREAIQNLAFKSAVQSFPVPENTKSWKISQDAAKEIVLKQFPRILEGAHLVGPVTATIQTRINGFANENEEVWHIRIICNKGGTHALFFVHPNTGQLYVIRAPNTENSTKCI